MAMQYDLAPLGPNPISDLRVSEHHVTSTYAEFLQREGRWSIIFVEHANVVQIRQITYLVRFGDILFVSPGARVSWTHWGLDCPFRALMFTLRAEGRPVMAIPHVVYGKAAFSLSIRKACTAAVKSKAQATALAWHLLWDSAEALTVLKAGEPT